MIMKITVLSYTFLLFCLSAVGQLKPIGSWTDHLPLNRGTSITSDGTLIYAATATGFFTLNVDDNSIEKFTKVNLLNDVEISQIAYSDKSRTLIVVYDNANIDLISNNTVTNIPFIKLSREKKDINSITIIGNLAYLSMAYGITVINLERREIVDTYKFGSNGTEINVTSVGVFQNNIYAGTNSGIYIASNNSNLLDFNSWTKLPEKNNSNIKAVWSNNNKLNFIFEQGSAKDSILRFDGTTFAIDNNLSGFDFTSISQTTGNKYILNSNDSTYIFENSRTIRRFQKNNSNVLGSSLIGDRLFDINQFTPLVEVSTTNGSTVQGIKPNGPQIANIFDLDAEGGNLWITNGAIDGTYNNRFDLAKLSSFDGTNWTNYSHGQSIGIDNIFDIVSVTINPNNSNEVFFGSWGRGIAHFPGQTPFKIYQDTNTLYTNNFNQLSSAIQQRENWTAGLWVGTGEGSFDQEGNLWMTNTYQKNGLLVRLVDGSWFSYNLGNLYSSNETAMFDIAIDDNGYKWLAMAKDNDIIVYDDNGTIKDVSDDRSIRLTRSVGLGSIPGQRGIKIEKDKDGLIWIGTSDGIAVHFNPAGVFDGDYDFDRIIFFDGENNEVVLQNSIVTEIAVDGFNRKWIGTENSGVILLSADGKETILEFNEDNSPLLSNTISAIAVDDESGEVYIATSKGLVSYRAEAISGAENLTDITIYPNPVRPEYKGSIAISGLLDQSTVKITDVHGTLINELKSEGGQALWDGNNFSGRRASTGVYLVFVSGSDQSQILRTEVGKILFVN
jgi:hypothetical protein